MNYTEGTEVYKRERAKKQMLWFGIISLTMTFAGLTSAYIVSRERKDWVSDYEFPVALLVSTAVIILSSLTIHLAKQRILKGDYTFGRVLLLLTLALSITFISLQLMGFQDFTRQGYYFTGAASSITTTFIFLITVLHIAHVAIGVFVLLRLVVGAFKNKYTPDSYLGLSLGVTFWHFVDILWVVLFVLFYFYR